MITAHEVRISSGVEPLEDAIGTRGHLAWVIDGATSLTRSTVAPTHSSDAVWLVERLEAALLRRADSAAPVVDILRESIADVRDAAAREWLADPEVPPSAAIALTAARPSGRLEYAVLADCTLVATVGRAPFVVTDDRVDAGNVAALARLTELLEVEPFHEAIAAVRPMLLERRRSAMNRNAAGGYWVAALQPEAADHALIGSLEISPGQPWWLMSDGFSRCVDLFGLFDWPTFVAERGFDLDAVLADVMAVERDDAEARAFPRWNISDDKAGARFSWSPDA